MNVDASRMKAVGYGESEPIATNETESGREKNRRIDVTINLPTP
jgi:OOP family OmpA-OmpF porin